ncbi:olfactory receptor 11A1-like [Sphaeramia orbicularis]|uniref:Olfactory receptor n=1 Tax=Sphaeramia orbicularis TaxID=375764 RepID=A0A673BGB6_9TELE|nr:olfactory receptor 11A1-like [Sphaeramia orbicularis]
MDEDFNVTYLTFGGHVEVEKYKYVYFMVVFFTYILIICSNSTIICLICIHQNLHEPMYIFIAALLVNSVLYSTVVYPKLLIDFLSEKQVISYSACLFQYFMFYVLVASEFLLLAAMAYDRYVSICKPLQYPTIMRKTTVTVLLVLAWLVPLCEFTISVILINNEKFCRFTLPSIFCNNSLHKLYCVPSRALTIYGYVLLINLAFFPVIFILFTYIRIFIITYRSSPEVRKKAAQTCLPHLLVLISFSLLITYNVVIVRLEADMPKTAFLIMTLQLVLYHPLFNPIIYGLKMTEIYVHLKNLLCPLKLN